MRRIYLISFESKEQANTSLKSRVKNRINQPHKTLSEAIAYGIYHILRKLQGYRLEHIFADDFYASQFFVLVEFISEEAKEKEKAWKNAGND